MKRNNEILLVKITKYLFIGFNTDNVVIEVFEFDFFCLYCITTSEIAMSNHKRVFYDNVPLDIFTPRRQIKLENWEMKHTTSAAITHRNNSGIYFSMDIKHK